MFRSDGIYIGCIKSRQYLLLNVLPTITPFVRFATVNVDVVTNALWKANKSVGDIVSAFGNSIDAAFNASKLVVKVEINHNKPTCFPNHAPMLDYMANELLPIFESAQCCTFDMIFRSDKLSARNFVASLLQLPAVVRKSNILVELKVPPFNSEAEAAARLQARLFNNNHLGGHDDGHGQLYLPLSMPVDSIASWLHNSEGARRERFLRLDKKFVGIENPVEIARHLKEVISPFFT